VWWRCATGGGGVVGWPRVCVARARGEGLRAAATAAAAAAGAAAAHPPSPPPPAPPGVTAVCAASAASTQTRCMGHTAATPQHSLTSWRCIGTWPCRPWWSPPAVCTPPGSALLVVCSRRVVRGKQRSVAVGAAAASCEARWGEQQRVAVGAAVQRVPRPQPPRLARCEACVQRGDARTAPLSCSSAPAPRRAIINATATPQLTELLRHGLAAQRLGLGQAGGVGHLAGGARAAARRHGGTSCAAALHDDTRGNGSDSNGRRCCAPPTHGARRRHPPLAGARTRWVARPRRHRGRRGAARARRRSRPALCRVVLRRRVSRGRSVMACTTDDGRQPRGGHARCSAVRVLLKPLAVCSTDSRAGARAHTRSVRAALHGHARGQRPPSVNVRRVLPTPLTSAGPLLPGCQRHGACPETGLGHQGCCPAHRCATPAHITGAEVATSTAVGDRAVAGRSATHHATIMAVCLESMPRRAAAAAAALLAPNAGVTTYMSRAPKPGPCGASLTSRRAQWSCVLCKMSIEQCWEPVDTESATVRVETVNDSGCCCEWLVW
jgi:hypothetical protein